MNMSQGGGSHAVLVPSTANRNSKQAFDDTSTIQIASIGRGATLADDGTRPIAEASKQLHDGYDESESKVTTMVERAAVSEMSATGEHLRKRGKASLV